MIPHFDCLEGRFGSIRPFPNCAGKYLTCHSHPLPNVRNKLTETPQTSIGRHTTRPQNARERLKTPSTFTLYLDPLDASSSIRASRAQLTAALLAILSIRLDPSPIPEPLNEELQRKEWGDFTP
ncbi:MAG: hypothetical protein P1U90_21215 [Akkermansiaceae bacterium]|nr:hypothetical protein [Akkermansiaceae bacterium]